MFVISQLFSVKKMIHSDFLTELSHLMTTCCLLMRTKSRHTRTSQFESIKSTHTIRLRRVVKPFSVSLGKKISALSRVPNTRIYPLIAHKTTKFSTPVLLGPLFVLHHDGRFSNQSPCFHAPAMSSSPCCSEDSGPTATAPAAVPQQV